MKADAQIDLFVLCVCPFRYVKQFFVSSFRLESHQVASLITFYVCQRETKRRETKRKERKTHTRSSRQPLTSTLKHGQRLRILCQLRHFLLLSLPFGYSFTHSHSHPHIEASASPALVLPPFPFFALSCFTLPRACSPSSPYLPFVLFVLLFLSLFASEPSRGSM